jgi:long-chain fatty acid transport protein
MQREDRKLVDITFVRIATAFLVYVVLKTSVYANGIYGNGTGAESMAMGGTDVAWAHNPLEAMGDNPAGLGFLTQNEFDLGGVMAIPSGSFSKGSAGSTGSLNDGVSGFPEAALAIPIKKSPVTVGISFIPQAVLLANWSYLDPASTGGISYSNQTDKSEIWTLRSAVGAGVQLGSHFSVGLSLGAIYNQNELVTPYVFQNVTPAAASVLNGAKTLLNLNTSGWGWNAQIGMIYRPLTNLQFGLSYQNQYTVHSHGTASGNAYAQFHEPPGFAGTSFHYNAEVDNTFPNEVALGGSWKFLPKWRLAAEVDWIDWADAFKTLPVKLTDGSGAVVGLLGSAGENFNDAIPLNWKSEFVYRAGLQYEVAKNLFLRAGYSYGNSPVPDSTLTPMTAAIMENTITAGVGYQWRDLSFDLAYQCDLPATQHVGTSDLRDGEYSNSSTRVSIQWLALTVGVKF